MLEFLHAHPMVVRGIQAGIVSFVALAVALYGRGQGIMLLGTTAIAIVRGVGADYFGGVGAGVYSG